MANSRMGRTQAATIRRQSTPNFMSQGVLEQTYDAIVVGSGATGGWVGAHVRRLVSIEI
jgi:hypothetical protein